MAAGMGLFAGQPVATITSSDAFTLSGVRVSAPAVSSWPLTSGDQVQDLNSPAVIRFQDGTQIALAKGSSFSLDTINGKTVVRLESGSMTYKVGSNSQVDVYALDQKMGKGQNGVSVNGQDVNQGQHNGPSFTPPGPPQVKPPGRSQGE